MPLFNRRSRSVSVSRPTTPSNNSPAMLAASQAFLGNQGSQTKLATGAAAAALRSMSPANTPVSQLQTKRMMERQGSVGSQNAQRGRSRGNNIQRSSSQSSMTERTFREPSPRRPASASGLPISRGEEPPVPRVPETYANIPPIPQKSKRRSVSIDGYEPAKNTRQQATRNSMIDTSALKPAANPASAAARRVVSGTGVATASALDRIDSNGSQNFSYPGRARPTSPPPQSPIQAAAKQTALKGISQTESLRTQNQLIQASQQPVKKKKKQRDGPLAEGSHLKTGTMGSKPTTTPLGPNTAPASTPTPKHIDKDPNSAKLAGQASHFPPSPISPTDSQASYSDSETPRRRAQRASGALQKQPSIVREDWEGEEAESDVGTSPTPVRTIGKVQTPEANVSRKMETNSLRTEQKQADPTPAASNLKTPEPRKPSLSPSRSARFSNRLSADMTEGQRHEPPPRSVSPRKSVLKHSPQTLGADRRRDPSVTPSEATDTSNEGRSKAKKSAHVTFDSHPAIVGVSAEPETPVSPTVTSPQNMDKDKRWTALGKSRKRVVFSEDSDEEDSVRPRSALPTFSSVRNQRNEAPTASSQRTLSSLSSSSSSSLVSDSGPTTMDTSISSDHAIGGLLAREAEHKPADMSSFYSQTTSQYNSGAETQEPSMTDTNRTKSAPTSQQPLQTTDEPSHLPSIAVQPATPGTEDDSKPTDQWLVEVPGSFPGQTQDTEIEKSIEPSPKPVMYSSQATVAEPTSPTVADLDHKRMPSIQEEDSDRDSVYSDAAEDLSDMEGDGFGSINAIVRSPVSPSPQFEPSSADSPVISAQPQLMGLADDREAEWTAAQARWKDNAETAKRATLQPAAPIVERQSAEPKKDTYNGQISAERGLPRSSPASTASTAPKKATAVAAAASRAPTQPAMRKSMRSEQEESTVRTMRNRPRADSEEEVQRPMRSSMRAAPAPMPAPTRTPVVSSPPLPVQGTLQKKSMRTSAPPAQQRPPPVVDDSDSDSSFRRRRRARANNAGGGGFARRSMRAGGAPEAPPAVDPRAVRSMSPVERRPFSPVGGQSTMKTTMRGSVDKTASLRPAPPVERRSSSLFGRRKEAKNSTRPMSMGNFSKSRFAADSDDEGGRRPQAFKSRYADSSDEEGDLRPVRGIPRRNKDDDSTDLDDSSDEEASRRKKAALVVPSSPQVSERPTSPMSMETKKKRGFFGRLKKDKDEPPVPALAPAPTTNGKDKASGKKPKQNTESAGLGFDSDAQKEALIEQTRQKLLAASGQTTSPTQSPNPGKLQRRQAPQRIMSDSWPLPPKIPDDEETPKRPYTSDGPSTPTRPELGRAPSSPTAVSSPTGSGSTDKTGKKKRFPLLRKAFGLKD